MVLLIYKRDVKAKTTMSRTMFPRTFILKFTFPLRSYLIHLSSYLATRSTYRRMRENYFFFCYLNSLFSRAINFTGNFAPLRDLISQCMYLS